MTELSISRFSVKPAAFLPVLLVLLSLAGPRAGAWEYSEFSVDAGGRAAMMARAGDWNPYIEVTGVYHSTGSDYSSASFTAGSYYRAAPWLKVGAFYRMESGVRHLDDWTVSLPDNQVWEDVSGRIEHLIYLDATPRFLLFGDPPTPWVLPVKTRYFYNLSNGDQTLMIRPGITYALMPERRPIVNFTLNYSLYFALNFGEAPLYAHGPYLAVLGHVNDFFKLEGRLEYLSKTYSKNELGGLWTLHSNHFSAGIGAVFTPDFTSRR